MQSTPLFTESTTTTTTITGTPPFNVFDMGTGASGVTVGPISRPISPLRTTDPDTVFGDSFDDFQDFHYSPFVVQQESDEDDAPMTKRNFKALNIKLDSLLESTKASSSSE